jgi:2Fe-2S ferredoxin
MVDLNAAVQTVPCEAEGFEFEAPVGSSLMLALKGTGFDIEASCEGCLVCGTCHVQVHEDWVSRLPPPGEDERAMLASLPGATPRSRLSCQILVTPELAGLRLDIAH